jgi:mannitol-1-phosphate/altronate dehydrogenase
MVNRITPRPPPEPAARVNAVTGQDDRMSVTAADSGHEKSPKSLST